MIELMDLKALFSSSLVEQQLFSPRVRQPRKPRRDNSYEHTLYPVEALESLIGILRERNDPDHDLKYSVRYIVDENRGMWFSFEGVASFSTPGHREMASRCLAAGNVFFSDDYTSITKITHCSGDFRPDVGSLVWPLAILAAKDMPFHDSFSLQIIDQDEEGLPRSEMTLGEAERALLLEDSAPLRYSLMACNSGLSIHTDTYVDEEAASRRAAFNLSQEASGGYGLGLFDNYPASPEAMGAGTGGDSPLREAFNR